MTSQIRYKFRLYVAGGALNSGQALNNLRAFCERHLLDSNEIEVIDVFEHPDLALADGIFMTPTLIKLVPDPVQRIIGTLSQAQTVLDALGLEAQSA